MEDSSRRGPIPTIEDYLNVSDWGFDPKYDEGRNGDYFWVSLNYDVEFEKFIPVPRNPYRILVTYFDWWGGAAKLYGSSPGWKAVNQCAISDAIVDRPPIINYRADTALMFLDKPLTDQQIQTGLTFADEEPDPSNSRFWSLLDHLQPYLYISYMAKEFFAAREKILLDALHSADAFADVEAKERADCRNTRAEQWKKLGPECGPEKCVESGCDRLRIKLAIRCFIHQLRAFAR